MSNCRNAVRVAVRRLERLATENLARASSVQGWLPSALANLFQWATGATYHSSPVEGIRVLESKERYDDYRAPLPFTCPQFNGTSSYYSRATVLQGQKARMTCSAWIKSSVTGIDQTIVANYTVAGNKRSWNFGTHGASGGTVRFQVDGTGAGTNVLDRRGSTVVCDGDWHHVAAVWDWSLSGVARIVIYVDGQEDGTTTIVNTGSVTYPVAYTLSTTIGKTSTGNWYTGRMSEVRVLFAAYSATEILAIYNEDGRSVTNVSGIVPDDKEPDEGAIWWLADNDPAYANDASTNANNAVGYNITTVVDDGFGICRANTRGYSLNANGYRIDPRVESAGNEEIDNALTALDYVGQCPYPIAIESHCLTGNGSDFRAIASMAPIPATADFMVDLWYYVETLGQAHCILAQYTATSVGRLFLSVTALDEWRIFRGDISGGTTDKKSAGGTVTPGWHHVVIDKTGDDWTLTVDDVDLIIWTADAAAVVEQSNMSLLGRTTTTSVNGTPTELSDGCLAEVKVSVGGVLVFYAPFQEGAGESSALNVGGTPGLVLFYGTKTNIWNNLTSVVENHFVNHGGYRLAGIDWPGSIYTPGANPLTGPGGNNVVPGKKNANASVNFNPFGTSELIAIGAATFTAGDDPQTTAITNTKFVRTGEQSERDRFVSTRTATVGDELAELEAYTE